MCGVDVNYRDLEQMILFFCVVLGKNVDLVRYLIENGVDVCYIDVLGCFIFYYVCIYVDNILINVVIKVGCIFNNIVMIGKGMLLQILVIQNDMGSVCLLLEVGYDFQNDRFWVKLFFFLCLNMLL